MSAQRQYFFISVERFFVKQLKLQLFYNTKTNMKKHKVHIIYHDKNIYGD